MTFTATVSPATATGTVTFKADGNAITGCGTNGAVSLSGGSATCASAALTAVGSPHAITAHYSGDATYAISSASLANGQTVNKANATVTTWPTAAAITYGQTLASATLSGGAATPAGSFAFTSPATKPSAGTAAQSVTYTPTDTGNYNTALNTVSVTVNKANQTITFSPAPTVMVGGIGTVSAMGGASGNTPTFNFTNPAVCATGLPPCIGIALAGYSCSTVAGVSAGTCAIIANQAGNDNYNPAPPTPLSFPISTGLALTVNNLNKTGGTVTSDVGGISCGASCTANFAAGTSVKLTGIPINGYQFLGWGGSCSGYGSICTITIDGAKSVSANFDVFKKKRHPKWKGWLLTQ